VDDGDTIPSPVSADNLTIDIRQTAQLRPGKVVTSYSVERIMTLLHGSRSHGDFTMKLSDHVAEYVKFKCRSLES
jgi:hypothetical protein